MKPMDYEGKKVYVKLISDRIYTGLCIEVTLMGKDDYSDIFLFTIKDKFGETVCFTNKEIKFMETEK